MAKCVPFLGGILLVAPLILHECAAEWGTQEDRDLVVQTFDLDTDPCTKISSKYDSEERTAADENCWKSFNALDAIRMNTCGGWISAKCRKIDWNPEERCTCTYTYGQNQKNGKTFSSFRHCAWNFGSRQPQIIEKEKQKEMEEEKQKEERKKSHRGKLSGTGTSSSYNPDRPIDCPNCDRKFATVEGRINHGKTHN